MPRSWHLSFYYRNMFKCIHPFCITYLEKGKVIFQIREDEEWGNVFGVIAISHALEYPGESLLLSYY